VKVKRRAASSRRGRWWIVAALAVLVLAASGFALYRVLTPTAATTTERTVEVTSQTVRNTVGTTGTLEPKHRADLSFASSGTVTSVHVSVGEKVKKGALLATINDDALQADLSAAKADLQSAKDDLADLEDNDGTATAISAATSKVAVQRSTVTQAKAALAAAKLRSTISGTVALVNIAKGDTVGSSTGAGGNSQATSNASTTADITVISTNSYIVTTSVGSADLAKIKKGLQAEITPTGASAPIYGTVASVGIIANSSTSTQTSGSTATFAVTIDVTEAQKGLFAGASVTVSIIVEQRDNVLTVPTAALSTVNGKTIVQKLVNGTKTPTEVSVGTSYGAQTEITKGLVAGDQVVITFTRTTVPSGTRSGNQSTGTGQRGQGGGFGQGGGGFGQGGPPAGGG
jgi:RND family efflux transporter MFP subunit